MLVVEGRYVASDILGENELTLADIALLPFVEIWLNSLQYIAHVISLEDISNIQAWY
jgi:glutathione S-transferase